MTTRGYQFRWGACYKHGCKIVRLANNGKSLSAIARMIGTNKRHVKAFLLSQGIVPHHPYCPKGGGSYRWSGGRNIDKNGYVLLYAPDHPLPRRNGIYILEHRLVMEKHLGRYLTTREVVHHKNKNKEDNRIDNLELYSSNGDHLRQELAGKCPKWTPQGLEKLKEAVARSVKTRRERSRIRKEQGGLQLIGNCGHQPTPPDIASPFP